MKSIQISAIMALVAVGGTYAVGSSPAEMAEHVGGAFRTHLTRVELNHLSRLIRMEHETNGTLPPANPRKFAAYVREVANANFGRDPSHDLWGRPYSLITLGRDRYGLLSLGLDGKPDRLCKRDAPTTGRGKRRAAQTRRRSDLPRQVRGPDDVCVIVKLDRGSRRAVATRRQSKR